METTKFLSPFRQLSFDLIYVHVFQFVSLVSVFVRRKPLPNSTASFGWDDTPTLLVELKTNELLCIPFGWAYMPVTTKLTTSDRRTGKRDSATRRKEYKPNISFAIHYPLLMAKAIDKTKEKTVAAAFGWNNAYLGRKQGEPSMRQRFNAFSTLHEAVSK